MSVDDKTKTQRARASEVVKLSSVYLARAYAPVYVNSAAAQSNAAR